MSVVKDLFKYLQTTLWPSRESLADDILNVCGGDGRDEARFRFHDTQTTDLELAELSTTRKCQRLVRTCDGIRALSFNNSRDKLSAMCLHFMRVFRLRRFYSRFYTVDDALYK
jgi:hypothetical protein